MPKPHRKSQPSHEAVSSKIAQIESEMKRIGMWQTQPRSPEQLDVKVAFGADKLIFEQWLQFIFIPRVKVIVATGDRFPPGSQVAAQAFREWKMWSDRDDVEKLLEMLKQFDALFE